MFHEQAVHGDVVAVDDEALRAPGFRPSRHGRARTRGRHDRAPDPQVIADHVPLLISRQVSHCRRPHRPGEEDIAEQRRVGGVIGGRSARAHFHEHG
jgi:hypothetical protein